MLLPTLITLAAEQAPEPEDVKAGWTAFLIFVLLIAAVVFLGFSLVKQLRKAQAAEDAGLYDQDDKPRRKRRRVVLEQDADDDENAENGEPHRS
jgi:hypothetical protein